MTKGYRMSRRKEPQSDTAAEPVVPETTAPTSAEKPFVGPVKEELIAPDVPGTGEPISVPSPPPPPPPRRGGFFAPLLGGALAGVAGFALSHFNVLGLAAPDASAEVAQIGSRIEDLTSQQAAALEKVSTELSAIDARIAALEAKPEPAAPDLSRLDGLDERLAAIEAMPADGTGSNAALTAKLAELERRLTALPKAEPSADLQKQLDEALARLDAAETAATDRATEAEAAVAAANRTQALDALASAVVGGRPFAPELQVLADPTLDAALASFATDGVPTLAGLQSSFPDAARETLRLARKTGGDDGWTDRLVDFLASQTGARPVTPIEGDTPDAILSRAEFALSESRVSDALAELDALDPVVKGPLEAWIAQAKTHVAATAALQAARGE
jgi:hypothetical protein